MKDSNCCFCDSYPNDGTQYVNTHKYTGLPDKMTVNVDKNFIKMPKIKCPSWIRRPGLGIRGCYLGGPWVIGY